MLKNVSTSTQHTLTAQKLRVRETKKQGTATPIAKNHRARFDFDILDTFEAGIVLVGSEVKSLRLNTVQIKDCYVQATRNGELELVNLHISRYDKATATQQHETHRSRKILLHKREIKKILDGLSKQGMTAIPLRLFFNGKGIVKVELGLARGKKNIDKRNTIKQREWDISKRRLLKEHTR